jgi:hypothetical protein
MVPRYRQSVNPEQWLYPSPDVCPWARRLTLRGCGVAGDGGCQVFSPPPGVHAVLLTAATANRIERSGLR